MIAYDLDGVFVPDYHPDSGLSLEEYLRVRYELPPLFEPHASKDYLIITGRPVEDKDQTEAWIDKFFNHPPLQLIIGTGAPVLRLSIKFKSEMIKAHGISVYIESDIRQVRELSVLHPGCTIKHFQSNVQRILS